MTEGVHMKYPARDPDAIVRKVVEANADVSYISPTANESRQLEFTSRGNELRVRGMPHNSHLREAVRVAREFLGLPDLPTFVQDLRHFADEYRDTHLSAASVSITLNDDDPPERKMALLGIRNELVARIYSELTFLPPEDLDLDAVAIFTATWLDAHRSNDEMTEFDRSGPLETVVDSAIAAASLDLDDHEVPDILKEPGFEHPAAVPNSNVDLIVRRLCSRFRLPISVGGGLTNYLITLDTVWLTEHAFREVEVVPTASLNAPPGSVDVTFRGVDGWWTAADERLIVNHAIPLLQSMGSPILEVGRRIGKEVDPLLECAPLYFEMNEANKSFAQARREGLFVDTTKSDSTLRRAFRELDANFRPVPPKIPGK